MFSLCRVLRSAVGSNDKHIYTAQASFFYTQSSIVSKSFVNHKEANLATISPSNASHLGGTCQIVGNYNNHLFLF